MQGVGCSISGLGVITKKIIEEEGEGTPHTHTHTHTISLTHKHSLPNTLSLSTPCRRPPHPQLLEIDISLPNNKRQHRSLHILKNVLPYALC